ncbi:MAG: transposase [Elusimicrobia bacterium]|nr:transposase [Elusimicrobiota bacterium]
MAHANDDGEIFLQKEDYLDFLSLLESAKDRFACKVYAYCLLSNHLHLLVEPAAAPISKTMQWLLSCHSRRFNWRHNRKGHLFRDRFKSLSCTSDAYFLQLLRYINLNPVRAGCVARPEDWPWSGHSELLGTAQPTLIDPRFPLEMFDARLDLARSHYREFVHAGLADCRNAPDPFDASTTTLLPNDHTERILPTHDEDPLEHLSNLARQTCLETGVPLDALVGPSRTSHLAQARRLLATRALGHGIIPSRIAAFLKRDCSFVSRAVRPREASHERKLRNV